MSKEKITRVLLAATIVLVPFLVVSTNSVGAAALTDISNVLSNSDVGENSDHLLTFVATSGVAAAGTLTVTFDPTGSLFDLTSVVLADVDLAYGATCGTVADQTLAAAPSGATWGAVVTAGADTIEFTSGTGTITAGDCVIVEVGTVAGGTNQINNPAGAGVYEVEVTTASDSGSALVAVLDNVDVDVTVDETLTFTVTGQGTGDCVTTTDLGTTATSISYGSVTANTFYDACQQLEVSTNATGGYAVTVQQTQPLTSAGLDTIAAGTCDGACTFASDAVWTTASNNGLAYCMDNVSGTDAQAASTCSTGGSATYRTLGTLGTDTPEIIMSNSGVVNASQAELNLKISVPGSQPAGTYSNEIFYVATPTY